MRQQRTASIPPTLVLMGMMLVGACDSPAAPVGGGEHRIELTGEIIGPVAGTVPVAVTVTDARGRPVHGAEVRFAAAVGSGRIEPDVAVTDNLGVARSSWTLDTVAGTHTAQVRAELSSGDSIAADITATALPGAVVRLEVPALEPHHFVHPLTLRLQALGRDRYGNPVTDLAQISWATYGVAGVTPVPDSAAHALLSTRGPGQATVMARLPTASGYFEAAYGLYLVEAPPGYVAVRTGLTRAFSINVHGHVAGLSAGDSIVVWRNGTTTALMAVDQRAFSHWEARVPAINSGDDVLINTRSSSFLIRGGSVIPVADVPAAAFNDHADVVGTRYVDLQYYRGFIWSDGVLRDIPRPDSALHLRASDINNAGQVAVNVRFGGRYEPYLWQVGGAHTPVPRPSSCVEAIATALDEAGHLVIQCRTPYASGYYSDTGVVVWNGTSLQRLDPLVTFYDMNNRGEVLGRGADGIIYLWRAGQAIPLFTSGPLLVGFRINDQGHILFTLVHGRSPERYPRSSSFLLRPEG